MKSVESPKFEEIQVNFRKLKSKRMAALEGPKAKSITY